MDRGDGTSELAVLRRQVEQLTARLDEMESERSGPPTAVDPPRGEAPTGEPPTAPPGRVGRRRALAGLAGVAAAGTAAALAPAAPAAAANGHNLVLGVNTNNNATNPTLLTFGGGDVAGTCGIGVAEAHFDSSFSRRSALYGLARGNAFNAGVHGVGHSTTERIPGVWGEADRGPGGLFQSTATDHPAVNTVTERWHAITANGKLGGIRIVPKPTAPAANTAVQGPGILYAHASHDALGIDTALWTCVRGSDNTGGAAPGTWRKLAGPDTAGALHVLPVPKRVYDSRRGSAPPDGTKTPLKANENRLVDLRWAGSGVPAGATAAIVTILLVGAKAGNGNFTVWSAASPQKPPANTMVWGGSAGRFATQALTAVDAQARVLVNASAPTDVVIDVVGYYR